jgi:hypothetical protein
VTDSVTRDMATFIAATKAADEQDAQLLLAVVRKLREDDDLRYEHCSTALDAMARRMTERLRAAERWDKAGMLDETDVGMHVDDFATEAGTDHAPDAPPIPTPAAGRRGRSRP